MSLEKRITLEQKLAGRWIDAVYCSKCGINQGIYPMQMIRREYICPHCGNPMGNITSIKIELVKKKTELVKKNVALF